MLQSNDCGCVIYECTVGDEGAITWTGSAFDCLGANNEITLFVKDQKTSTCNDGAIKAQRNNNYTSQLIITNSSLSGSNIKCIHNDGTNLSILGNLSIPNIAASSGRSCCYSDVHNIG